MPELVEEMYPAWHESRQAETRTLRGAIKRPLALCPLALIALVAVRWASFG